MLEYGTSPTLRLAFSERRLHMGPLLTLDADNDHAYWSHRGESLLLFVSRMPARGRCCRCDAGPRSPVVEGRGPPDDIRSYTTDDDVPVQDRTTIFLYVGVMLSMYKEVASHTNTQRPDCLTWLQVGPAGV